jgi:chromate transporter
LLFRTRSAGPAIVAKRNARAGDAAAAAFCGMLRSAPRRHKLYRSNPLEDRVAQAGGACATTAGPPSSLALLRVWIALGAQSFGGGSATLFLIQRAAVERERWISDEEFARDWAICQLAPGINLLCLTALLGWRVAGARGALIALGGLLLPSAAITVLLTALYASVRDTPVMRAALRGFVPATVGLGLVSMTFMARPLLRAARRGGRAPLTLAIVVLLGSGALALLDALPSVAILLGAGLVGALGTWWLERPAGG